MNVVISDIPVEGLHLSFRLLADAEEVLSGDLELSQPLQVEADLFRLGDDEVYLNGQFRSEVVVDCVRCLNKAKLAVKSEFKLTYVPSVSRSAEEELLSEESLDLNYYDGESIHLDPELVGQLVLAIPMSPVCQAACGGLCSQCGSDLNQGSCMCQGELHDLRWTQLKNFVYKEPNAKSKT